jgi:hypothetical protein
MKFICLIFWTIILSANIIFAQQIDKSRQNDAGDWTAFFPVIAGCEREIQPLKQTGKIFEQTANYEHKDYKKYKNKNYFGCGSITLRFEPSSRKTARAKSSILDFPGNMPTKVKGFESYRSSPLCGNDDWIGSTAVYFDENKVLIVSANIGGEKILDFAQNADYKLLRKSVNKIVRGKKLNK